MMELLIIGGGEGGAAQGRDGLSRGGHASFVGGDEASNISLIFFATIFPAASLGFIIFLLMASLFLSVTCIFYSLLTFCLATG